MNQPALNFHFPPEPTDPADRAIAVLRRDPLGFKSVTEGWLLKNRQVWIQFYQLTEGLRATGRQRLGAKCIYETMRYMTAVRDSESTFKINNNAVSGLSRLYNAVVGVDFFETREI